MGFAEKMACLEAKFFNVTQELKINAGKAGELALEAKFIPGLTEEANKLREFVSAYKTVVHAKDLRGNKVAGIKVKAYEG